MSDDDVEPRYVHGYSDREGVRLLDQASTLGALLHADTQFPPGCSVLEAGCGYPLVAGAGLTAVTVSPRVAYADASRPEWIEGFTRNTFTAMIEGVRDRAVALGLMTPRDFDEGIDQLRRTCEADGSFSYTFYKAVGTRAPPR